MRDVCAFVGAFLLLVGLPWLVMGNEFFLYRYFAPQREAVRREVFEQTKSYQDGVAQDLRAMQAQYVTASDEHKAALASVIIHRATGMEDVLPADVRLFVDGLKRERGL
jgi:hypothetical protein